MARRVNNRQREIILERLRPVFVMPEGPLQSLKRLCPPRIVEIRCGLVDVLVESVAFEVRLNELFTGSRGDDFGGTACEELQDPACVVVVAMREDYIVLSPATRVEGRVVVGGDGAVF